MSIHDVLEVIKPEISNVTTKLKELNVAISEAVLNISISTHAMLFLASTALLKESSRINSLIKHLEVKESNFTNCLEMEHHKRNKILSDGYTEVKRLAIECGEKTTNLTVQAEELLDNFKKIETNVNKVIGFCVRGNNLPWQMERLEECIKNEIKMLKKYISSLWEDLKKEISENLVCDTSNVTTITQKLDSLREDLLHCVKGNSQGIEATATIRPSSEEDQASSATSSTVITASEFLAPSEQEDDMGHRISKLERLVQMLVKDDKGMHEKIPENERQVQGNDNMINGNYCGITIRTSNKSKLLLCISL